ncbi:MAG: aminotransferase class I/II-fold pyridoxal phosphate-dependent enzyme [Candidatus Omnitrophota bacterium]|nr:MAG: aminotransferase class I/II-fold pyridoxal phosphate-dependent enzyme [Candidatus Omnitrophota bacterium]
MDMKRDWISKKVEEMPPSGIRAFFDLVLGMKDVISLGVGEPDFVTPWQIREAGIYSLEQGYTSYTSNKGLYRLRLEIARFLNNKHGLKYSADDQILITVGVSEAMDLALRALINPNDKILIPTPSYVSYAPLVKFCGGVPVIMDTSKTDFKITPSLLERNIDKKVKAMIFNYPTNPTGVSYNKKELERLSKVLCKHNILCISDEIYCDLTYDFEHTPFATLPGAKDNTLYLDGFSKSYAMTGWRVGFACGPKEIIAAMTKIHQYTIMCVPIASQMAACEALQTGRKSVEEMKREYKRRRNLMVEGLNRLGITCSQPQGAFYIFASIKNTGMGSLEFAEKLLKDQKVAVVPGVAFGKDYNDYIRISYAAGYDKLKEALNRIEKFIKKQK